MTSALIAQADCFRIPLPDKSVHCVVTSPPYWGLRKYAGDQGPEPLGLEPTPERHIERTVEWAREVRRVLRDDGVFWLNYGDCYAGSGGENGNSGIGGQTAEKHGLYRNNPRQTRIAPGNLMMMPHRVALALQADGWTVRQDLVWSKPNPMPESVNGWWWQKERNKTGGGTKHSGGVRGNAAGDFHASLHEREDVEWEYGDNYELHRGSWRHTRAHEYVFQLTKGMQYFSDQEAAREAGGGWNGSSFLSPYDQETQPGLGQSERIERAGRNQRSVLRIPTSPYKGAHYATFPPALIAPLILATCPRWCCPVCGQGWAPVVDRTPTGETQKMADGWDTGEGAHGTIHRDGRQAGATGVPILASTVSGYRPPCDHSHTQAEAVPGIVCDPFVGSGTTVMVAKQLLRSGIGFDISLEYLDDQAKLRTGTGQPSHALDNLPLFST